MTSFFLTFLLASAASVAAPQDPLPEAQAASDQEPNGAVAEEGFRRTDAGRLEFHARNMDVRDVFRQLRKLTRQNIVVSREVNATFSGDLYDVSPEEAIEMVCRGASLRATHHGSYLFIEPAMYETRVYRLHYARAEDLRGMVQGMLTEGGKVSASSGARIGLRPELEESGGDEYAYAEVLVVRDVPENLDRIEELVETLDREPEQVLLEVVMVAAKLEDDFQMGISFDRLQGLDYQDVSGTSSGFDLTTKSVGGADLVDGIARGGTGLTADVAGTGLNIGWIDGSAAMFVKAVETVTDTEVLANTKILALNKQQGQLLLGRRDGYLTTTVSETTSIQTIEYLETGTQLLFRPFVGEDGRIRLEIHPEDSDGGLSDLGLPFENTAELTTNILVRDGQTVVIGGLFREKTEDETTKVPLLGDLPLLGRLFQRQLDRTTREELIILLTPHVIRRGEVASGSSAGAGAGQEAEEGIGLWGTSAFSPELLAASERPRAAMLRMLEEVGEGPQVFDASDREGTRSFLPAGRSRADDRIREAFLRAVPSSDR